MVSFFKASLAVVGLLVALFQEPVVGASVGNIGICYDPMHNTAYPIGYEWFFEDKLRAAINADFIEMAKYATNVRTYYSQYYGIQVADYAATYGLKLDLGVFMTPADWQHAEIDAAIAAIQKYPDIIESVLVGNENLQNGVKAADILGIVNQIKTAVGPAAAAKVKFGTVQRITDYVTSTYDSETAILSANLDVLGVNIYPFFASSYDSNSPTALLDTEWNQMAAKFPPSKMRLSETGFPTAGSPSVSPPSVQPSLSSAVTYYNALVAWTPPSGDATFPKFWFGMFDRRPDDNTFPDEYERHFGFFTFDRQAKTSDFPYAQTKTCPTIVYGSCGCQSQGVQCCPAGSYCMTWGTNDYQCLPKPVKCSTQYTYAEFAGATISTWNKFTPEDCCAQCAATTGCKGYSFVPTNHIKGTCYLKSDLSDKILRVGYMSAVLN